MKMHSTINVLAALIAVGVPALGPAISAGAELASNPVVAATALAQEKDAATTNGPKRDNLHLQVFAPDPFSVASRESVAWLGLATEEASEALISQLRLDPGVGLIVTYVATNSPAAKADLKKNDVLVEFDGQPLVHPEQLRKLVQVRKEGDLVSLTFYRAGEKKSASVTLARTTGRREWFNRELGDQNWERALPRFETYLKQFDANGDVLRSRMMDLQRSLGDLRIDQEQVQHEVRRSLEQARKAAADALRHTTNDFQRFGPTARILEDLARGWVGVHKDATVTVNSSGSSVRTMVKADDTGTYVIVANPQKRLTVHDRAGKLLFDGEIETPDQQSAVPTDIWQKVEPLVNKMGVTKDGIPEPEPQPEAEPEAQPDL